MQQAEELLRQGKLSEALAQLQEQVRAQPDQADLRVFLFQLLAVLGNWERAMTQLNVAAEMDGQKLISPLYWISLDPKIEKCRLCLYPKLD